MIDYLLMLLVFIVLPVAFGVRIVRTLDRISVTQRDIADQLRTIAEQGRHDVEDLTADGATRLKRTDAFTVSRGVEPRR